MNSHAENPIILIENQAKEAGINIDHLCEEADIARSTLVRGKYERHSPNWSTIRKLETALKKLITKKLKKHPNIRTQ